MGRGWARILPQARSRSGSLARNPIVEVHGHSGVEQVLSCRLKIQTKGKPKKDLAAYIVNPACNATPIR